MNLDMLVTVFKAELNVQVKQFILYISFNKIINKISTNVTKLTQFTTAMRLQNVLTLLDHLNALVLMDTLEVV